MDFELPYVSSASMGVGNGTTNYMKLAKSNMKKPLFFCSKSVNYVGRSSIISVTTKLITLMHKIPSNHINKGLVWLGNLSQSHKILLILFSDFAMDNLLMLSLLYLLK